MRYYRLYWLAALANLALAVPNYPSNNDKYCNSLKEQYPNEKPFTTTVTVTQEYVTSSTSYPSQTSMYCGSAGIYTVDSTAYAVSAPGLYYYSVQISYEYIYNPMQWINDQATKNVVVIGYCGSTIQSYYSQDIYQTTTVQQITKYCSQPTVIIDIDISIDVTYAPTTVTYSVTSTVTKTSTVTATVTA